MTNQMMVCNDDVTEIRKASAAVIDTIDELNKARSKHATPIRCSHEGYAVILEELDEVKAEVWKRKYDSALLRKELIQVAAMAWRMMEDLNL